MVVKRFVAANMQEAMKMIRDEIGPDAVILDSNPVRSKGIGGLFKQGVEVVAAYDPSAVRTSVDTPVSSKLAARPAAAARPAPQASQRVAARYAAAARPEPADKREDTDADIRELDPVIFPVLNLRDAAKAGAEPASPISTAVIEPENVPAEVPAKTEPAPRRKRRQFGLRSLTDAPGGESRRRRRPAFVEYEACRSRCG